MLVTIVDPKVNKENLLVKKKLICLSSIPREKKFTIIIFALAHKEFEFLDNTELSRLSNEHTIIFDLTNSLNGKNVVHL